MPENQESPRNEGQEDLLEIIHTVSGLCAGDRIDFVVGGSNPGEKDDLWLKVSGKYPQYRIRILNLRSAMKRADRFSKQTQRNLRSAYKLPFIDVPPDTTELLTDILVSRSLSEKGVSVKYDTRKELDLMAQELEFPQAEREDGLTHPFRSEEAKKLTLENVVGKVLEGKLRVLPISTNPTPGQMAEE